MKFEVRDGSFGYNPNKRLLNNINFEIEQGEIMTVLGANGAGKTTLMKNMLGLLKWTQGASYIDGVDIKNIPPKEIWTKISYVPQAKQTAFAYKVEEMVLLGRNAHLNTFEQPGSKDREIALKAMEEIGITYLMGKTTNEISGGELQMVLIARALCAEPKLLILDEPESNLDFKNQLIVLKTVKELSEENHLSAIVNTHYPENAIMISDKTLLVSKEGANPYGYSRDIITESNLKHIFEVDVALREVEVNKEKHVSVIPYM